LIRPTVAQIAKPSAAATGKRVTAIFAKFVTDQVSLVVHVYLLTFSVLAAYVCVRGIRWESKGPLSVHSVAARLVIWGVAIEALCTIALFVFDEGISRVQRTDIDAQQSIIRAQNDKIIALEEKLAGWKLSQEDMKQITGSLQLFPDTPFDMESTSTVDPWFIWLLGFSIKSAGWKVHSWDTGDHWYSYPLNANVGIFTASAGGPISILYEHGTDKEFKAPAEALAAALNEVKIPAKAAPYMNVGPPGAINIPGNAIHIEIPAK
jgi:hypothetical protein